MPYTVISTALERPDIDDRTYRVVELPNKLQALLIHDPSADKSAAALDVNAGAYHDPPELPGLAHFCEHLLFMGTEKYPSENEYGAYLSEHSGSSNAYTAAMHTNFYFEVASAAMEGALDRFAQFFIAPLFSASGKDREINAVDSENKKNLENDVYRLYQLRKSLRNAAHPSHGFSTGNKMTLGELPVQKGLDVREELLKYHSSHYSANLMRLVVLSNESLDTLTDWAVDKFSAVVNKDLPQPFYLKSPFSAVQASGKSLVVAKPVTEARTLELSFPVPEAPEFWQSSLARYLTNLLGHESEGSLLFHLKEKKWATGLSAGSGNVSPGFNEFVVSVELTKAGLAHYKEIVAETFKYVNMMNSEGPQEWLFQELHDQGVAMFKFREKTEASSTVSRLATLMHHLGHYATGLGNPLEDFEAVPKRGTVPAEKLMNMGIAREYKPELIEKYTSYFNPSNYGVMLIAKEPFETLADVQREKWYGTEYVVEKLDKSVVEEVERIYNDKILSPAYSLPEHNTFIPTNFSLASSSDTHQYPCLIETSRRTKIWYKKNTVLGGPRASLIFKFNSPGCNSTPLNSVLMSLFIELLEDDLNSVSYLASLAGLHHEFSLARDGMSLSVTGFSHKLANLLERLVGRLVEFSDPAKAAEVWDADREARFLVLRDKLAKNLNNFGYGVPYNQVGPLVSALVNENAWLVEDQIAVFGAVTFDALRSFATSVFDTCFIEALVVGNYDKRDAREVCDAVSAKFARSITLSESQFTRGRSLDLPLGHSHNYVTANVDSHNINSCVEIYVQLGKVPETRNRVLAELVAQTLHEKCFDRLRTKEQLGYVVFSSMRETRTTFGLRFLVQSEQPTPYLVGRIERFVAKMGKHVAAKMTEEQFAKHVNALVTRKLQKVKNLRKERNKYWTRIASGFYDLDRAETDAAILKTVSLAEFRLFFEDHVLNPKASGRLIAHLQSQAVPAQAVGAVVKRCISNFLYESLEFDDFEGGDEIDKLVDSKGAKDAASLLDLVLADPAFAKILPGFKYTAELKKYVASEAAKDYSEPVYTPTNTLIEQIGEWKCGISLTAAPAAKILPQFLDSELDSKL